MKKINKKWLKVSIFWLLIGISLFRFRNYLWEGFREIAKISVSGKIGIILASIGYTLTEGKCISRLAKAFHTNVKWKTGACCAYYCSFFRVVTFGGGAGAAEIYYLTNEGMEPAHAFDTSLVRYLCQKVAVTFAGIISLLIFFQRVEDSIGKYKNIFVYGVGIAVGVTAAIMLILLSRKTADLLFYILDWIGKKKESWIGKIDNWKEQIMLAQKGVRAMFLEKRTLAEVFGWNIVKYLCWFSVPYLIYGKGRFNFFTSIGLMAIATVMASVIPVPGGYGALEFMQILLFEPMLGRGRTVSMVILYRVVTTIIPALVGGVVVAQYKRKNEDRS